MMVLDKAERILDSAEELLVAYGFRKVTMDDVARRAGIGKGTAYLYWPSKADVFKAVLTRETTRLLTEQIAALHADPAEVQLHRLMRMSYLQAMQRPLARAFATADRALLGDLLAGGEMGFLTGQSDMTARYLEVLHKHELLADGPNVAHRLSAVLTGFFVLEAKPADIPLPDKADALATTIRLAFEPAEAAPEMVRAAAAQVIDVYQEWLVELSVAMTAGIG